MAAESAKEFEALEAQATTLLDMFRRAGYEQVAPSIIQPADIFLDQIGEAIRSRTYVFTDLAGDELCLRPDLTVPVSRLYLERHPNADAPARYCYNGPAFRFRPQGDDQAHPREFRQAGIECFGEADTRKRRCRDRAARGRGRAPRRAEGFPSALRRHRPVLCAARCAGAARALAAQAAALFLAAAGVPRAARAAGQGRAPERRRPGLGACREPDRAQPPSAPRSWSALISTRKALPLSGNRSLSEITARLLDHAADLRAEPLPREVATVIDYYLAVSASPQGGGRAHRHDRQGCGHRSRPRAVRLYPPLRALGEEAASTSATPISPPSSAAASNIIRAWCSRSRSRADDEARSPAAGAMTACCA